MTTHNVTIIEMEHHFLYLPVYFARDRGFFNQIPPGYQTKIVQAPAETDADAYRRLCNGEADLAICDPCAIIYARKEGFTPAVLAGLVARGAFWAVNTKSPEITELDELAQFEHIVAFHPGTTSHGIASRIIRSARGRAPIIESVRPFQEFTALEDLTNDNKSAVALSPDVLRLEKSLETNRDWLSVKLALAETVEYGHLLVTAVIARPDFVTAHPEFVNGFLTGLQRALIHARVADAQVIDYAREAFNQPENIVERALKRANDVQVWASDITVSEDLWVNAVQAYYDSIGQTFDAAARREAQRVFAESFKPHVDRAQRAAINLVSGGKDKKGTIKWKVLSLVVAGLLIVISGILTWQGHAIAQLPLALGLLSLPILIDFTGRKDLIGWNLIVFLLFILTWFLHWRVHWASDEAYIGTIMVLVVIFAERNFKIFRDSHKE